MKRILVLDGGGAMGAIQISFLTELEERLDRKLCECFDLIIGTSVGSIIGGMIAYGKYDTLFLQDNFVNGLPLIFKKNPFWKKYKYDRENARLVLSPLINGICMKDTKTKFMCVSVNAVDGMPHYFKSWEDKDGELGLYQSMERSFAAPYYFGPIVDEKDQSVWLDGGIGMSNSPVLEALVEASMQQWLDKEVVYMLSVGTGYADLSMTFEEAKKLGDFWGGLRRQIMYFLDPDDGGFARRQATMVKCKMMESVRVNGFKFRRVDALVDSKMNTMDAIQYAEEYLDIGNKMAQENLDDVVKEMNL